MSHGTHIQLHRSAIGGATPDVSNMLEGEPAVNLTDKKFYVRGASAELITFIDGQTASLGSLYTDGSVFASDVTKLGFSAGANIALATSTVGDEKRITISSSDRASTIAGSNKEVQYNASDGFSADAKFLYDSVPNVLSIGNGGISADGATFGARGITVDGDIYMANQSSIRVQGDTESIYMNAGGGQFTFSANAVDIGQKLRHIGDGDTYLDFTTDNVAMYAGNTNFLEANANGVLHTPTGVSGGGATFGGTVTANTVSAAVNASALNINSNYALPTGAGATGDVLMIANDGDLEFIPFRTTATFIVDSDIPLATGIRYKGLYAVPMDKMDVVSIEIRSHDVSPAGSGDSLSVALKFIRNMVQVPTGLESASPTIQGTVETVVIPLGGQYHTAVTEANVDTPSVGSGNAADYLVVDVVSNAGNHTNFTMLVTMEARP